MQRDLFTTPQALADELGEVRARIKRLKAHEAELRAALIDIRPNGPVAGARFEVTIKQTTRRTLDATRLPDAILDDERFWRTSTSQTVITHTRDPDDPDDDLVLFEPF